MTSSAARVVLYSTCYRDIEQYIAQWSASVAAQTDREFAIYVGLDDIPPEEALALIGPDLKPRFYAAPAGASPAEIRNGAFAAICREFDAVIMTDMDDVMLPTRVERAKASLADADLACCAMLLADSECRPTGAWFDPGDEVDRLLSRNVFGLSNTAYRTDLLSRCLPIPAECVLVDWLVATRAWTLGANISFDHTPGMLYRQYDHNIARVVPPFSWENVRRAANLILGHYRILAGEAARRYPHLAGDIQSRMALIIGFMNVLEADPTVRRHYVEELNQLPQTHVWWEFVAHPRLENVWKH